MVRCPVSVTFQSSGQKTWCPQSTGGEVHLGSVSWMAGSKAETAWAQLMATRKQSERSRKKQLPFRSLPVVTSLSAGPPQSTCSCVINSSAHYSLMSRVPARSSLLQKPQFLNTRGFGTFWFCTIIYLLLLDKYTAKHLRMGLSGSWIGISVCL